MLKKATTLAGGTFFVISSHLKMVLIAITRLNKEIIVMNTVLDGVSEASPAQPVETRRR